MTRDQLFVTSLSIVNVLVAGFAVTRPTTASVQDPASVLRARALEIVDTQGRVRASISVQPLTAVAGRQYPETVLLRLTDPVSGPVVKLTATRSGSSLGLSDDQRGGILLAAHLHRHVPARRHAAFSYRTHHMTSRLP
jgi:hypothetical protein